MSNIQNNPTVLTPKLSKIPSTLKMLNQWGNWKVGKNKGNGRYEKIPVNQQGYPVNAHNPKNWLDIHTAWNNLSHPEITGGISFDLSEIQINFEGADCYLIGGDFDECVISYDEGTEPILTNTVKKIISQLNTYYEVSPSGTGIRFFCVSTKIPQNRNKNGHEIYHSGRFLTVTGHGWGDIRLITPEELDCLVTNMFPNESQPVLQSPISRQPNISICSSDDAEKVQSALDAIPADIPREIWLSIVLSVKAHQLPDGDERVRDWSKKAGAYDSTNNRNGYSEKDFDNIWRYSPRTIGKATLYYHAKRYGWQGMQAELFKPNLIGSNIDVFGDILNGKAFRTRHLGQMLYCYPRNKWLKFNGTVWAWCDGGEELGAAKETAQYITQVAAEVFSKDPTNPNSKKLIQHSQASHSINRLEAMLKVAASEPDMGINSMNALDANPMLLGCKNGVIDLSTGHLLFPSPDMLITRQVQTKYTSNASASNWLKFLDQCFLGDQETIDYIQKAVGYSLTGSVKEESLFFCYGIGRNGKSVFANIITKLMGDYVLTAPSEMLMRRERNSATNDIARLCGSRLVLANETRSDQRFDDLTIKQLVSTERITARFLHNEFFEFWPTFKIWIRGNHKPVITDESEGAWRRIKLIPFENNLSEEQIDPHLEEKLICELEGILAWAVEGAMRWQKEGLTPSLKIKSASNQYRQDCDVLGEFITECCTLGESNKVAQSNLWIAWQLWSRENGYKTYGKKLLTRRLKERGILDSVYLRSVRAYGGIKLITTPSQDGGAIPPNPLIEYSQE